ncbi:DUF4292 domain-containing protein [Olivibacter sitiensis]|uniref:DUF4292 domain-containing protein n=1 Tax=Olivibacter sitiensis TaxID=376470 RepID=UPI000405B90E|nr:DUF4292 domain-containing protein [Olivibacter sitiensis]
MLNKKALYICLALFVLFGACKTKKKIATKEIDKREAVNVSNKARVIGELRNKQVSFDSFSARAKTNLIINDDKQDVTLNLRIKDKQAIWVSVTAILGLEVARVLITPDSFKVVNRINNEYIEKPFSELYRFSSVPLSFVDLQSLLVGRGISAVLGEDVALRQTDSTYIFSGKTANMDFALQTATDFSSLINQINNTTGRQSLVINYGDYALFKQRNLPQNVKLRSEADNLKLFVHMQYDKIEIDNPIQIPFSIPNRYRKID